MQQISFKFITIHSYIKMYHIPTRNSGTSDPPKKRSGSKPCRVIILAGCLILLYFLTFGNLGITDLDWRKDASSTAFVNVKTASPSSELTQEPEVEADTQTSLPDDPFLQEIQFVQENFEKMEQTDPKLIRYVRARYLTPPPPKEKPYNLKYPEYQKTTLGKWIRTFYKNKRNGVFFEAGANSGESTNTIELEIELGWSGILVECNPRITPELRNVARKTWIATVCLSMSGYPKVENMSIPTTWTYSARLGPAWDLGKFGVNSTWSYLDGIESVPLYSILAAAGIQEIDYFSFDIEGAEFAVLKSFPFDKVVIKFTFTRLKKKWN
ncbi:uncharacterized protein LOC110853245 isoform X2 [Folsomia candida]|uniref:uncharacterized protein LOC110853245 isoform X2 n=1 Tax=Folsomia candida TaxID=158441 RepID=UPI001604A844|nr:uncharacterized protein LOC110853245 isoform X2 [Folsomia candida]